jgi:hypothetical protein
MTALLVAVVTKMTAKAITTILFHLSFILLLFAVVVYKFAFSDVINH